MGRDSTVEIDGRVRDLALRELCISYFDPERKPQSLDDLAKAALAEIRLAEEVGGARKSTTESDG